MSRTSQAGTPGATHGGGRARGCRGKRADWKVRGPRHAGRGQGGQLTKGKRRQGDQAGGEKRGHGAKKEQQDAAGGPAEEYPSS